MTVSLCIRQASKRNDDSVSVEELDWSAERQVLIPAEHLWCDFKCRSWAKNSSPNTHDLYIHYMDKSTGTPPSLEEKKVLSDCGNKEMNVLTNCISTSVATVLKCMKWLYSYVQVIGDEVLAQDLHFKSNQIKSLLLSHHHSTSALVSEILTSVLQTVQKNKTIYIWTVRIYRVTFKVTPEVFSWD